jgi:hypothetical protein
VPFRCQAGREADRAAERALREQERAVAAQRDELQARVAAQEAERDAARLARLRESAALEQQILDNRQRALEAQDVAAAAQAEADRVRNEAEGRALADRKAALDDQYNTIVRNRDAALAGLDEEAAKLTIAKDRATELAEQMKRVAEEATKAVEAAKNFGAAFDNGATNDGMEAGPTGFSGPPGSNGQTAATGIGARIANSIRAGLEAGLNAVREGIAAFLADDGTTAPAVEEWTQTQIIDPVEALLEIASPSKKAEGWAASIAEGFIDGLTAEERRIIDALEAPWIEIDRQFWPEVERKWKQAGADHARAYDDGFSGYHLDQKIEDEIEEILRRVERNEPGFKRAGRDAGIAFTKGFCDNLGLVACFERAMKAIEEVADDWGASAGRRFTSGFESTARSVGGSGSTGGSGGGGGGTPPQLPIGTIQAAAADGRHETRVSGGMLQVKINGFWYVVGPAGGGGLLSTQPQTRALGGPLWPNMDTIVGEHGPEIVRWQAGTPTVIPHTLSMSTLGGAGLAQINSRGAVSVSVNQTIHASPGMDPNALARVVTDQAVAAIIDVLDDAERRAPNPLSRILPGALR